jgi:hypothetical protein
MWEPLYHYIPAGFFNDHNLLIRKMQKQWCVGLSMGNTLMYKYSPDNRRFSALPAPQFIATLHEYSPFLSGANKWVYDKEQAINNYGAISRNLYLGISQVYYMHLPIGEREGTTFRLTHQAFRQEIFDALRGVPCLFR